LAQLVRNRNKKKAFYARRLIFRPPIKNSFCVIEKTQLLKTHLNKNSFCGIRKIDWKNHKVPRSKPCNWKL